MLSHESLKLSTNSTFDWEYTCHASFKVWSISLSHILENFLAWQAHENIYETCDYENYYYLHLKKIIDIFYLKINEWVYLFK